MAEFIATFNKTLGRCNFPSQGRSHDFGFVFLGCRKCCRDTLEIHVVVLVQKTQLALADTLHGLILGCKNRANFWVLFNISGLALTLTGALTKL